MNISKAHSSLYQRIGGENAVQAAVTKMYDKILSDELLAPFFENVDVDVLRLSQRAFVSHAFGAATPYRGSSLRDAHRHAVSQGLTDAHFDRVNAHLQAAMRELGVSEELIAEAAAIVESTRGDVLNR